MALQTPFKLLMAFCLISASYATILSSGLMTAESVRAKLNDSDFKIQPKKGFLIEGPGFTARIADLNMFPAMAGADVQTLISRVAIKKGMAFFRHFHPRGRETLNCLRGELLVSFNFEGAGQVRKVSNHIRAGESTVFPQGLVHDTKCVSNTTDCLFLSVFNTADPGTIAVA